MALFQRKNPKPRAPTVVIEPDPQAFAPIPPPAPYGYGWDSPSGHAGASAPLPQDHLAVQQDWVVDYGDEADVSPVRRRRYAKDTEYIRDLELGQQDGIGHTTPGYHQRQTSVPDPRWFAADPNVGKRPDDQVRNQDKFTYFRPYDQEVSARRWNAEAHPRVSPDLLNERHVRQGNYAIRSWRLTSRQDPTSGETYDRVPAAHSARVSQYNATSTIRRNFRL